MNKKLKYILFLIVLLLLVVLFMYLTRPHNYLDPSLPVYVSVPEIVCDSSSYEELELTVVTYNVKHGEKIEEAIEVLNAVPNFGNKVLLLQEMHPDAIAEVAELLGMYSVYFPLNKGYFNDQDFGNGILATMPLLEPQKIIFPFGQIHNDRRRGMTTAMACLGGKAILLGSVHTSTVVLEEEKRKAQIDYLKEVIGQYQEVVDMTVIGGDFNAVRDSYKTFILEQFAEIGFEYTSAGLGVTHKSIGPLPDSELDLIFCDNCKVVEAGVVKDNSASDHYPVWIQLDESTSE